MRRITLLLVFCLLQMTFAMSDFTLEKVRGGYTFELTLPNYTLETEQVDAELADGTPVSGLFTKALLPGYSANGKIGAPQLLSSSFDIALEDGEALVDYKVTAVDTIKLSAPLYPNQHALSGCSNGMYEYFSYDKAAYDALEVTPAVSVAEYFTFRTQNAAVINVAPMQYNAEAQELYIARTIAVTIDAKEPTLVRSAGSRKFDPIVRNKFKNLQGALGEEIASEELRANDTYLMIVADKYKSNADLQRLIDYRKLQYDVEVVSANEAGATKDAYRDYIRGKMPTFVLLVGDDSDFPSHAFQFNMGQMITVKSFSYYICARTSGEPSPEIAMGVFLIDNDTELKNMVDKTLAAEANNTQMPNVFVGVGGNKQQMGSLKPEHCDQVVQQMGTQFFEPAGYENIQVYSYLSPKGDKSQIINATNSGARFINYNGHGMQTNWVYGWGNNDLPSLTNTEYFPYVLSCCCYTGTFDMQCMARAYTTSANGPSAFIASYEQSSMGQHPLNYGMYDAILTKDITKYGLAFVYAANSDIIPTSCQSMPPNQQTTQLMQWQYHLYGDPALETIEGGPDPQNLTVTSPNGGEKASLEENFEITWSGGDDDKATITLLKGGSKVLDIADDVDGNSYTWKVTGVEEGNNYKVVVTCGELADTSDANFTVKVSSWSKNLVSCTEWVSGHDKYEDDHASTVSLTQDVEDTMVSADYTIGKMDSGNDIYPWANISAILGSELDGVSAVKISYKSDKTVSLTLDQEGLMDLGTSHMKELPATNGEWSEIVIKISDFAQPGWVKAEEATDLDLKKVKALSLAPVDYECSAKIAVKVLKLEDYNGEYVGNIVSKALNNSQSPITVSCISNNSLQLTIVEKGTYKVSLYTVSGRLLMSKNMAMVKGLNQIDMGTALSSQVLLLSVEGKDASFMKKCMMQ